VKPAAFTYVRPGSLEEALLQKAGNGDAAAVLAGGQSLVPMMNMRMAQPRVVLDVGALGELNYLKYLDGILRVGAVTRMRDLERSELVAEHCPVLHEAVKHVAHPVIRNRGTVGGSVAHADPAAELPAILVLLEGSVVVRSTRGIRTIAAVEFFKGPFTTALVADEIITELHFVAPSAAAGTAFREVVRRHGDFALAGAAAVVANEDARVVLFGVDTRPIGVTDLQSDALDAAIAPTDDVHGSAHYRRRLVRHLVPIVLQQARERAR
jgi:CO/xanthine dehydrogenase FAD-binding subunit